MKVVTPDAMMEDISVEWRDSSWSPGYAPARRREGMTQLERVVRPFSVGIGIVSAGGLECKCWWASGIDVVMQHWL